MVSPTLSDLALALAANIDRLRAIQEDECRTFAATGDTVLHAELIDRALAIRTLQNSLEWTKAELRRLQEKKEHG